MNYQTELLRIREETHAAALVIEREDNLALEYLLAMDNGEATPEMFKEIEDFINAREGDSL